MGVDRFSGSAPRVGSVDRNTQGAWGIKIDSFKSISLFSGAQGLDIGLGLAGVDIVLGQDVEPSCVQIMAANGHKGIVGDIRSIEASALLQAAGLAPGEPFLVCGGPPCQPFSTAGKRLGINDPRGSCFRITGSLRGQCRSVISRLGMLFPLGLLRLSGMLLFPWLPARPK